MAQYISKDAIVAEIEKCYNECLKRTKIADSDYWSSKADAYRNVLVILDDTLEVKEIDLEKEYDNEFFKDPVFGKLVNRNAGISIAKHFYELGMVASNKARKGEDV